MEWKKKHCWVTEGRIILLYAAINITLHKQYSLEVRWVEVQLGGRQKRGLREYDLCVRNTILEINFNIRSLTLEILEAGLQVFRHPRLSIFN